MSSRLRHALATGQGPWLTRLRAARRAVLRGAIPWPRAVVLPYRWIYVGLRAAVHVLRRVFVAEPIFRSYCAQVGRGFHTDIYVHWVQGAGRIVIGDDVLIDGKCSFSFAARFSEQPTLKIGNRTGIGHGCTFVVAREITIGDDCRIAAGATFRDSPGHPIEPEARRRGEPPPAEAIQPIVVQDNVWIGAGAIIQGGVQIGAGSVIASGAVVLSSVPEYSLMAGNPARRIGTTLPGTPGPTSRES